VEQQKNLRLYYSQYFASLISATEMLLEKEYPFCTDFKDKLDIALVFDEFPSGSENYSYIRELRNSIIHRGFDISSTTHVDGNMLMLIAPPKISNRSGTQEFRAFGFYLLEIIEKCEAIIGPTIASHLEEKKNLFPTVTHGEKIEQAKRLILNSSAMTEWVKAEAVKFLESDAFEKMQTDPIADLIKILRVNALR
jgi:hypothetical protein